MIIPAIVFIGGGLFGLFVLFEIARHRDAIVAALATARREEPGIVDAATVIIVAIACAIAVCV